MHGLWSHDLGICEASVFDFGLQSPHSVGRDINTERGNAVEGSGCRLADFRSAQNACVERKLEAVAVSPI